MTRVSGSLQALLTLFVLFSTLVITGPLQAKTDDPKLSNDRCLRCHGREGFSREDAFGVERDLHVTAGLFSDSVHAEQDCVGCHQDIIKAPHRKGIQRKVSCVTCHVDLWNQAVEDGTTDQHARLGVVSEQIGSYMDSMHARPNKDDQSRTNATCYDCHDAHYMKPFDSENSQQHKLENPAMCGNCHGEVLEIYQTSVHGLLVGQGDSRAAVCSDCHSRHGVNESGTTDERIQVTRSCGTCHQESLESYLGTYHGKITRLGYGETAKCYDCHGSHQIKRLDDPASMMNVENRLETCQTCHEGATQGFVTFQPHGNMHDREKYPEMWFASMGMIGLLIGTFSFFWLHSALWFHREYKDRKEGKNRPHVLTEALPEGKTHFRRFNRWWRLAHLTGAVSIMTLTLTGITVLYADSSWAPYMMRFLGGPETAGYIHRVGAIGFMGVFFVHLIYFAIRIGRNWRTFEWFGPNSLVPNWNDLKDAQNMFRWFFGLGPRPQLDRFSYWEKFDYWAPFWGMTIIGVSGLIMWFPIFFAAFLPGWAFNVAAIVHGEEAFLAAVFLFTVHFFNNHFRPDKFPQDTTMFTGRVPLEVYKHEHRREYERLLASGELDRYLVDAPTEPQSASASLLGATLISFGLFLLTLVILGFFGV